MKLKKGNRTGKLTDHDLVAAYRRSGNSAYMGILYERYYFLVYGVCLKYLKNRDDSKDAVNRIFEKLIADIPGADIRNFGTWLFVVTKNHCLMQIRSNSRKASREEIYAMELFDLNSDKDSEAGYGTDMIARMKDALVQLKEEQRRCLELFYLEEKPYREVAQITGYAEKKVKSFIQNGKRNLKIIMNHHGK
ncbi:MAG: sigma-70 family RNA polymerase sigma factor [Bacteroidota bacterium]